MSPASSRPATIDDVAAAAGVSVATVSRAMRNLPNVAPSTAERVRQAAQELHYRPTPFASGLAAGRTHTVAIAVPMLASWYFAQVLAGAESALTSAGYDLLVVSLDDEDTRRRVLQGPLIKRADGVILLDVMLPDDEISGLTDGPLAVVTLGFEVGGFPAVLVDDIEVARLAVSHLLDHGHRDIAVIGGEIENPHHFAVPMARRDGYLRCLTDAGITPRREYERAGGFTIEGGAAAMAELLALDEPPTAVFAMSDEMAAGAMRTLAERGLDVPGDISIVGVDDHEFASVLGLTTVRQPVRDHGTAAVDLLLALLADPAHPPSSRQLPVELVVRRTVTAPSPR